MNRSSLIISILLSVILFITGFYTFPLFFEWTTPAIEGVNYTVTSLGGGFKNMLAYSFTLGLIPISIFFTWQFAPVIAAKRKIINILILISCISVAGLLRQQWLLYQAKSFSGWLTKDYGKQLQFSISVEDLDIPTYMFAGLLAGTICSYFLLRQKITAA